MAINLAINIEENDEGKNSIERFEVLRELGRGGTSIVCLVRSRESGRQYAMKTLKPDLSEAPDASEGVNEFAEAAGGPSADGSGEFRAIAAELLRAEAETLEKLSGSRAGAQDSGKRGTAGAGHPGIPAYYGKV